MNEVVAALVLFLGTVSMLCVARTATSATAILQEVKGIREAVRGLEAVSRDARKEATTIRQTLEAREH